MDSLKKEVGITCLNCGRTHLPPNRNIIDNWTCPYCFSGFLSLSFLSNLIPRDLLEQISSSRARPKNPRACPQCHTGLELSTVIDGENRVELDYCHHCRFLWFDSGEITRLLRLRPLEKAAPEAILELMKRQVPTARRVSVRPDWKHLFWAFLASAFAGRLVAFLMVKQGYPPVSILGPAVAGAAAFALVHVPYRELLFPEERWKSPATQVAWFTVIVLTIVSIFLGWDFFHSAFRGVAFGARGSGSGSWLVFLGGWLQSSVFLSHFAGVSVGVFWGVFAPPADTSR